MDSKLIHQIISDNTKIWVKNPKSKKILLKGRQLKDALEFLKKEGTNFILKSEVDYIKTSLNHSRKKKFLYTAIVVGVVGFGGYYMTQHNIYLDDIAKSVVDIIPETKEKVVEANSTKVSNLSNNETKSTPKEIEKIEDKNEDIKIEVKTSNTEVANLEFEKLISTALSEKSPVISKHLLANAINASKDKEEENIAKIIFNSINLMQIESVFKTNLDILNTIIAKDRLITYSKSGDIEIWDIKEAKKLDSMKHKNLADIKIIPNEEIIASISTNGEVKLWNLKNGKNVGTFTNKKLNDLTFSKDSRKMITVGEDGKVEIWDVNRRRKVANLKYKEDVQKAIYNNLENRVLTISNDRAIIWGLKKNRVLLTLKDDKNILSAQFSDNDRQVLTNSGDSLILWNASRGKRILEIKAKKTTFKSVKFSKDEKEIIATNANNEIVIYNMKGKEVNSFKANDKIRNFIFNEDLNLLLITTDKSTNLIDTKSKDKILNIENSGENVVANFISQKEIVVYSGKDEVDVYSISSKEKTYSLYSGEIKNLALIDDKIVTYDKDNVIKIWNKVENSKEEELKISGHFSINKKLDKILLVSGNIFKLLNKEDITKPIIYKHKDIIEANLNRENDKIISYSPSEIILWDLNKNIQALSIGAKKNEKFINAFFSSDDSIMVVVSNRVISLYDINEVKEKFTIEQEDINSAKLSNDNKNLIISTNENLKFINLETSKGYIIHHKDAIDAFFNADATKFYTLNKDSVKIWDTASKNYTSTIKVEAGKIAINKNEDLLLAKNDKKVSLIDIKNSKTILEYSHKNEVIDIKFNLEQDKIISYDKEGIVKITTLFDKNNDLSKSDFINKANAKTGTILENGKLKVIESEKLIELNKKF